MQRYEAREGTPQCCCINLSGGAPVGPHPPQSPLPQYTGRNGNAVRQPLGEGESEVSVGDTPTSPRQEARCPLNPAMFIFVQHHWGTRLVLPGLLLRNACPNEATAFYRWRSCTTSAPSPARIIPIPCCQVRRSPRNSQARTAICTSIVLLMMLDSMAERVRSV